MVGWTEQLWFFETVVNIEVTHAQGAENQPPVGRLA